MEILSEFGFDLQLFIAQIVNFLILAFLFKKFLYKPLLRAVKKREENIKQGLDDAEKAHEALVNAEQKKDEIINAAAKEAEQIIMDSKKRALTEAESIVTQSKVESERIIKNAKEQAELERQEVEKQIGNIAIEASQRILTSVITDLFTDKERDEILKRSIKKIKSL